MLMTSDLTIALVGATGAVGMQFLRIIEERGLAVKELRPLATKRSAGTTVRFRGEDLIVEETSHESFNNADVAFISATTAASEELCPIARDKGAVVFDDSSAWRQHPDVPLVVPEVNGDDLRQHKGIISTPNCSTVPLVLALAPLMRERTIRRVVVDTYQSTSGAGTAAMAELRDQTQDVLVERPVTIQQFSRQIAFNAIPHIDSFLTDGYTKEERKMLDESRKILHEPDLAVSATCVRIPTMISHAMAVNVDFDEPISVTDARACWETQSGLELFDDPLNEIYPTPLECTDQDATFVGRVRQDVSSQNGLAFWCVTDNLRKGAALNILQMVEWMQERDCL